MNKKTKRLRLQEKRKEIESNTRNGRRKENYSIMGAGGILGNTWIKKYISMREEMVSTGFIHSEDLPWENPIRDNYLEAKKLYNTFIQY